MALDYDKDLSIDPQALDVEWLKQPRLYMRYAEQLVDAKDRRDRLAQRLDVTKADADTKARQVLAATDAKVTVDMVRAQVMKDADVQSDTDDLLKAEHEVGILQAAVKAFDMRKDALENMVRLHGQMYFAGPTVPRNIGDEFAKTVGERAHEAARDAVVERTRGRRGN